jgi:hypothetical protein
MDQLVFRKTERTDKTRWIPYYNAQCTVIVPASTMERLDKSWHECFARMHWQLQSADTFLAEYEQLFRHPEQLATEHARRMADDQKALQQKKEEMMAKADEIFMQQTTRILRRAGPVLAQEKDGEWAWKTKLRVLRALPGKPAHADFPPRYVVSFGDTDEPYTDAHALGGFACWEDIEGTPRPLYPFSKRFVCKGNK